MRLANLTDERLAELAQDFLFEVREALHELIDRRAEAKSELRKLEAGLAYDYASSLIDGCCLPVPDLGEGWFDIRDIDDADEPLTVERLLVSVAEAVTYLEARGLIERDATNPNHVSIRNESEATA